MSPVPHDFKIWAKRFILYLRSERNASVHTLTGYEKEIQNYFVYLEKFHDPTVQSLLDFRESRLLIREYWTWLSKQKFKSSTLSKKLAVLRSFFRFLILEDFIEYNPFQYLPLPKKDKPLPKFLTEKEMESFMISIQEGDHSFSLRDRALMELLYSTGLRIQEMLSLNVEDIDFWNGMVRVLGKGGKERIVPIGREAFQTVQNYLKDRQKRDRSAALPKGALFLNRWGTRLTPRGARKIINRRLKKSGLNKNMFPHIFRHSFATHLLDHGCDLRVVQELLGHKSLNSTQIYTHTSIDRLKKIYQNSHPRA